MTFSYVPTNAIGRIRRTIPDRVEEGALFSDEELQSFLDDEGDWRRASAAALEMIASDAAMIMNISAGGTSVNASTSANALLKRAADLRAQADDVDASSGSTWAIAEWAVDPFSARERLANELLRDAV